MYFLFFGGADILRQRLPDAVQEEGVLLDAVPLEVCLELLKQLGGHLKRHRPHIVLVHLRIFLHFIKFGDERSHVPAQRLAGFRLSLPYFGMQLQGNFSTEVARFFCHSSSSDLFNGKAKIPESKRESYDQSQRNSGTKQWRYQQSGYATRMAAAIRDIINSTQGIATLLCEAQHNSVYLIMVVMRRTDVKTAPGEDSWRSCFT